MQQQPVIALPGKASARAPWHIGIEIGGTKLQAVLGDATGCVRARRRMAAPQQAGGEAIRRALPELVADLLGAAGMRLAEVTAIGVGFGGPLDAATGQVLRSFQVNGWDGFPLRQWAQETWGLPTAVANDAATAGLAEARLGAGCGMSRVFYITVGSGVGGGWIVDGRIDNGQGLGMAELGHTWVADPQSGRPVELESICSGWSIGRRARLAAANELSILPEMAGGLEGIDARAVYAAAETGDRLALRILHETTRALGLALANIAALFHPQAIILGGGVALMGPLFWDPLQGEFARRLLPPFGPGVRLVPSALGEDAVPVGGLCLAGDLLV
jgi:glucokinase